jgi:hypothetical protein
MPLYCLFVQRAILDGRAGLYYTFQRTFAELLLSLYLIEAEGLASRQARSPSRSLEPDARNLTAPEARSPKPEA